MNPPKIIALDLSPEVTCIVDGFLHKNKNTLIDIHRINSICELNNKLLFNCPDIALIDYLGNKQKNPLLIDLATRILKPKTLTIVVYQCLDMPRSIPRATDIPCTLETLNTILSLTLGHIACDCRTRCFAKDTRNAGL